MPLRRYDYGITKTCSQIQYLEHFDHWLLELSEKQRELSERRFGLHGYDNQTLEEVGKGLGLTRERIRQIQNDALKKLRHMVLQEGLTKDLL